MERCSMCKREMDVPGDPRSVNCGGDCLQCMAEAGDPDCIRTLQEAGLADEQMLNLLPDSDKD